MTIELSVTGGYNGGANFKITVDTVVEFSAVGQGTYNLTYSPDSGTVHTSLGDFSVSIAGCANSTSPLIVDLTGIIVDHLEIMPAGNNTSWGYNYTKSYEVLPPDPGFDIVLMTNTSAVNVVDKSVSEVLTVHGVLREGSSILDPTIEVETYVEASMMADVNYAYISTFGRYYLITDIVVDINGLWLVSMHVDVLMSYKEEIRNQYAVVARQERRYNMYLDDGWFMLYQNPDVTDIKFSVSDPFEGEDYVLVLAGS